MRKTSIVLASLATTAFAAAAGAYGTTQLSQILPVAAGVAAHHVCSMTFVGGQDPDQTFDQLVMPVLGDFGRMLKVHVSRDTRTVEVSGPLSELARARFTPGYGCRLVLPGDQPLPAVADAPIAPRADGFAPKGRVASSKPAVTAAIDNVFAEHAGQPVKRVKAVVIVKDGQVVAERYADGIDEHSPLLSFSVAKSFTNALFGILVRQGKLRVDESLNPPEWKDKNDPRRVITLEDLMRMRSGLAVEEAESAESPVAKMEFLHGDMAAFAAAQPAKEPPGRTFEYTSADTVLLARKLGSVVGGGAPGMREFARRELFAPLGMGDVTMEFDGAGTFIGSTYVYASARDYARLGWLYLRDGIAPDGKRVLPEGWMDWSRRSTLNSPYGAGFWTNDGRSEEAKWRIDSGYPKEGFYASGTMGQRIYVIPSAHLVITRFGYSAPPYYGMRDDLALIKAAIEAYR
ncbi:serine hydrolase [Dyella marensis]|uniref:serine hydrolase domain-containing protein n=1 Tax=Dyella marensis TaxID=500610 RepID=UPI0031D99142